MLRPVRGGNRKMLFDVTSRGRKFVQEVVAEMKKVTWPSRPELLQATLVVIVAVAIMAAFLGLADQASEWITDQIF